MAIDKRGYYYRSERINGQPRRIYVAGGEIGKRFAEIDEALRTLTREKVRNAREEAKAFKAELDQLDELTDLIVTAHLMAAGYHRHDRGSWRRKRERKDQATP